MDSNAPVPGQIGQISHGLTAAQIARPRIVKERVVVPHGKLGKALADLSRAQYFDRLPPLVQHLQAAASRAVGGQIAPDIELASLVVHGPAKLVVPLAPLMRGPLDQLVIGLLGVASAADDFGHIGRGGIWTGDGAAFKEGDLMTPPVEFQGRRQAENARPYNADAHRARASQCGARGFAAGPVAG